MARRTWAELAALLADNSTGEISEADLRDAVIDSAQPHVEARPPTSTDDTASGFDVGHTWIDTSASPMPEAWRCVVSTPSAAIWSRIEGAKGDPGDPGLSWEGAWDDTTPYALGAVVRHAGSVWIANTGNTNKEPGVDAEWDVLAEDGAAGTPGADGTPRWMGAWSAGSYAAGDAVGHGGSSYVANASTTQEPPHADWDVFAAKGADGSGADAFLDLTDAPSSFSGAGGKVVAVNSGATALEFIDAPSGSVDDLQVALIAQVYG